MNNPSFHQITPHVYWLAPEPRTDRPLLGALAGESGSLVVDAGNSAAHAQLLLEAMAGAGLPPPAFVALTHWHWDHVFGLSSFSAPALAHVETRRAVAEMVGLDWSDAALDRRVAQGREIAFCAEMIKLEHPEPRQPALRAPEIAFQDGVEINLGPVTARLCHVGGDHGADASVVYVPEERVMFTGDCLSPDIYSGPYSYTAGNLLNLVETLLNSGAEFYLEGHNPQPLSREDLAAYARLFEAAARLVEWHREDREAILAGLLERVGSVFQEEHAEIVDAFLAGLRKGAAE